MDLRRLMNQLKMVPLKAEEVIIKFREEEWIFKDFELIETALMGEKIFQLRGVPIKRKREDLKENDKKEEDIKILMEELNINKEKALELLERTNWELAEALLLGEKEKDKRKN